MACSKNQYRCSRHLNKESAASHPPQLHLDRSLRLSADPNGKHKMGEIFTRPVAPHPMEFTGERLTSDLVGETAIEHWHRYLLARDVAHGRDVLDIACGEGYGSALLAQTANSVIGVDLSDIAVEHASRSYIASNLSYLRGDARRIPLKDASVDLVVSFETLEHFVEHEAFLAEVRRVLRPGGALLVSTPERDVYSPTESAPNPYHKRELTQAQFRKLLAGFFKHITVQGQRVLLGSAIIGEEATQDTPRCYERRGDAYFESSLGLARTRYIIALATDSASITLAPSFYVDTGRIGYMDGPALERLNGELPSLRSSVARVPELEQALATALANASDLPALRAMAARIPELEQMLAQARPDASEILALRSRVGALEQGCHAAEVAAKTARAWAEATSQDLGNALARSSKLEEALAATQAEVAEVPALRRRATALEEDCLAAKEQVSAGQAEAEAASQALQIALMRISELEEALAATQAEAAEVPALRRRATALERSSCYAEDAANAARGLLEVARQALRVTESRISELERSAATTQIELASLSGVRELAICAEQEVARLHSSTSWRVTRPLRLVARILRREPIPALRWIRGNVRSMIGDKR